MSVRPWILSIIIALMLPGVALARQAEDSQIRYINELKQRNTDYGPGCNGIGVSTPRAVSLPTDVSTRWAAGHSACIPGLRLVMACLGEVVADDRIIGCTILVAEGEAKGTLTCERLTLIAPEGRFQPDPRLSVALARGSEGIARPCSDAGNLETGAAIAAAFIAPADASAGDLALTIDIDGSEIPAFLIPASQVNVSA